MKHSCPYCHYRDDEQEWLDTEVYNMFMGPHDVPKWFEWMVKLVLILGLLIIAFGY
jgi:hypothetical protein